MDAAECSKGKITMDGARLLPIHMVSPSMNDVLNIKKKLIVLKVEGG